MSEADTNNGDPEIERINLRISRSFREVIDETWRERGFNSRSEFIRYALRESVNHRSSPNWMTLSPQNGVSLLTSLNR